MSIVVPIDADTSALQRKLHGATSSLGGFAKMAGLAAGAAALGGLVATLKIGTERFMEHEKIAVRTDAVLKSTGHAAHVTAKQVDELAKSIMAKSGIDNEQIQTGENVLLQFRAIQNQAGKNNDIFNQATQSMADMSVVMGGNTTMAAKMLGKALQDPEKAMGALKRANITFTDSQRDAIKFLDHHNRTLEAQKMVLEAVTRATGGQADALGNTLQGKLNIASTTFKNLAMDIAGTFMPKLADAATKVADFFSEFSKQPTLKAKIDFAFETASQVASRFLTWWSQPSMETVRSPTSGVHVVFNKPGSQQVSQFIIDLDAAVTGRVTNWAGGLGYEIPQAMFGGARRSGNDLFGSLPGLLLKWSNAPYILYRFGLLGYNIAVRFWNEMKSWFDANPGLAAKKIKEWLTSAGDSLGGAAGAVWDKVSSSLTAATRRGIIHRPTVAKILTDDMKAAIQSARSGLAGAASGLADMLNQTVSANFRLNGVGPNAAESLSQSRDLEDRRLKIQEDSLKAALAATEDGSAEQKQAQLDLDQFYFDKSQTLRQRAVEDEQAKNQTAINNLVTRFNTGLDDAKTFADGLDAIIGGEKGTSLGDAFSLAFSLALQSAKNAAADIFNIAGTGSPIGPDISRTGPATLAAQAAYNDELATWRDQRQKLSDRLRELRDQANNRDSPGGTNITPAEQTRINNAQQALEDWVAKRPDPNDYGLALGGILTGPRYLAGEAGNEAVIPLGSQTAAQMMRRAFSGAVTGGDTIYNVEINAGVGTDPNELGRVVVNAIKTFERKNGPVFASV